ncbi:hypothetical protein SGQ83_08145 [Flavobacterium sp. Fl-318]|uniref:Uncharacterized protein n=1 Tax=Flavobacterium cupriresistens TaxID=2893885 RepID=A0ABU4R9Q4_9FLAO|nr:MULTISPECIES: hypothetical protein [unclassified Flavobacterium]MDX6189312.1 hypothetical protein [Flavobacterium sp. Fl-318]UFH41408.1 hypothetical protein LNP23_16515 [Flavobacterium sp. F-323]
MKKKLLLLFTLFFSLTISAQVNPTLAVGLEKLTMNKGTIDVEVLTEIIMGKQKELRQEALRRFMYRLFPEANFTTKYYVQNCLNVLLNEKNPQVIEKEILELTTNYSLSLGVAYAILKSPEKQLFDMNYAYSKYKISSPYNQDMIIKQRENHYKKNDRRKDLNASINTLEGEVESGLKVINTLSENDFARLVKKKNDLIKLKKKLARLNLRENITNDKEAIIALKKTESLKIIDQMSSNNAIKSIDSVGYYLSEFKDYLQSGNNIIQLNNYLIEINNSISKYEKLLKMEIQLNDELNKLDGKNTKEKAELKEKISNLKIAEEKIILDNKVKNITKYYIEIPFGIILDVVSLSLSDIPELQKKGFFKNKIDYRTSEFYSGLESKTNLVKKDATDFKKSLDSMKVYVCRKITPYVKNYDVINEFLKKNKGKKVVDIMKNLQGESIALIAPMLNEKSWKSKYSYINDMLNQIRNLESEISIINADRLRSRPNVEETLNVNCESDCGKLTILAYNDYVQIQNILTSFREEFKDPSVQNQVDAIIKDFLKVKAQFKFSSNSIPDLKHLDATSFPDEPTIKVVNEYIDKINKKIKIRNSSNNNDKNILTIDALNSILELDKYLKPLPNNEYLSEALQINSWIEGKFVTADISNLKAGFEKNQTFMLALDVKIGVRNRKIKTIKESNRKNIDNNYNKIAESNDFYNEYLTTVLDEVTTGNDFDIKEVDSATIAKASVILPKIHATIKSLINNDDIHMSDIVYLDEYISEKMIELKVRDQKNDALYDAIISHTKIIIPLLKIRALQGIKGIGNYDEELMNLFEFISNLNNLDKAETYQSIVNMLRDGSKKVEDNLTAGEFKDSYILFINAMKKYTLINPAEEYVEIDVVSFLNELQQYYNRNNKAVFSLYLSLGLDQNFFFKNFKISDTETINNISFASEKIGVKWRIANFKRFEGYENVVKDDVYLNKKAPFINEIYSIVYGSGLLYNVANTTTNENFDFPHVGVGVGMRFYNALDVNLILGFPFVKDYNFGDNAFYGFGLDIPLGEYLEKLGSKNK